MPDSNAKTIKFKFEMDNQSFQQVHNAIKTLVSELQKLGGAAGGLLGGGGGAFPGLSIGGTTPGKSTQVARGNQKAQQVGGTQQTMGKVILDNAQAFKKFANDGKEASKIMTDALKRDIGEQERSLDGLKKRLSTLSEEFTTATRKQKEFIAAGHAPEASVMGKYIKRIEGEIAATSGQTLQGAKNLAGSQEALAAAGGGPKAGFMSQIGYTGTGFGGPGGGMAALMKGIATAVVGGLAVAKFGYNEVREGGGGIFSSDANNAGQGGMDLRAEARRGQLVNQRIRALRGGDISQLMIQEHIRKDPAKSKYYQQQMDAMAELESYKKGAEAGVANLPILGGIAAKVGLVDKEAGVVTTLEGLTTAAVQDRILQNIQGVEGQAAQSAGYLDRQMAFEHFRGTLGSRTNAMRVMGQTLEGRRDKNGLVRGDYGSASSWAISQGLSPDAVVGNYASLRQMGGARFGGAISRYETLSQAGGFSGFGAMAAQASRGGGTGAQALQLARGALGGGIATGAGMALGNQIFGYNALGTTSGEGMLSAIQGGIDWRSMSEGQQFNKVQSMAGAMAAGNAIATGSLDPSSLGSSTLAAKRILMSDMTNKNRLSTRATDYLASGMDFRQMVDIGFGKKTKGTEAMQVYGIGQQDVRRMATSKLSYLMKAELSDPATGGTVGKVIKSLESGVSPEATLKGLSKRERMEFNVALKNRTGMGGEEASTLADIFSGMGLKTAGRKIQKGDALGATLSGPEKAEAERAAQENQRNEQVLKEENKGKGLEDKIKGSKEAAEAQKTFGTNLSASVDMLVGHLDKLAGAMADAADRISGKAGMKTVVAKPKNHIPSEARFSGPK